MRILAVSHPPVWPVRSGNSIRRLMTLRALAALGTVDLLYVGEVEGYAALTPADAPIQNVWERAVARRRPSALARVVWLLSPRVPYQMLEWDRNGRDQQNAIEAYDLVWYFRPLAYELAGSIAATTRVIDLDDLEDEKLRQLDRIANRSVPLRRRTAERRNATAWRRYQRRLAGRIDALTVCKEVDRERLGTENCYVVPNGFPQVPVVCASLSDPPVLLFVGLFSYEPNADAARFFVEEVLPLVREKVPGVELRLVGRGGHRLGRLEHEGVTVVGEAPDLTPEYERATAAIVPLRLGSGTRVKILEAFARGVPVVSTTLGAAGLHATPGKHLLVGDRPKEFADACTRICMDATLRNGLSSRARTHYLEHFGQNSVDRAIERVVSSVGAFDRLAADETPGQ